MGVDPDHFWRQHQTNFRGSYLGDDEAEQVTYPAQDLERMGRIQESSYKVGRLVESQIHFLVYIYNHNNKVSCHVRPCCSKVKDHWADAGGGHGHEPEPEQQDLTHVHVGNGHGPCASILDLEAFKQTDKQTTTHTARQTD